MIIIALVVIALAAQSCNPEPCCDVEPAPGPGPDHAPLLLVTGDYRVQVLAVQSVDCRGAEPAEFEGQVAWGFLDADRAQRGGGPITFDLDGLRLTGTMNPGWLSASGSLDNPEYDHGESDTDEDVTDVDDTGGEEKPNRGGGGSSGGGSGGGGSSGGGTGHGGAEPKATAALEVQVMSAEHAEGTLAVFTGECNYTVAVRMNLGSEQDAPPEVDTGEQTDTAAPAEPDEDQGSDCDCDSGADCDCESDCGEDDGTGPSGESGCG